MIHSRHVSVFIIGLNLHFMALASQPIAAVDTHEPVVALTFDDGPHTTNTLRILDVLSREKATATFFEIGRNVTRHPELTRAIVAAGHEVGNHSTTHINLSKIFDSRVVRDEVVETQKIIRQATGITPILFRAPFLAHSDQLWVVLKDLQLASITTRVPTRDWNAAIEEQEIIQRATAAHSGDIILMHTWADKTVAALPTIIARLRAKGLSFVTVSELLASPTKQE